MHKINLIICFRSFQTLSRLLWITTGIRKSIKVRDKLFNKYISSKHNKELIHNEYKMSPGSLNVNNKINTKVPANFWYRAWFSEGNWLGSEQSNPPNKRNLAGSVASFKF